jgi:hypothetical protein
MGGDVAESKGRGVPGGIALWCCRRLENPARKKEAVAMGPSASPDPMAQPSKGCWKTT